MKNKKILIVSMTSGFGHIRAGQALLDYAREHLPSVDAEHIDISNLNPLLKKITLKLYDAASKKMPFIWGAMYQMLEFKTVAFVLKKIGGINYYPGRNIRNHLLEKHPDHIIFTNVIPLPLFNVAFRKQLAHTSMSVVVTDYHGHSYYNFPWLDHYFVATGQVKEELEEANIDPAKIVVSGIPIDPRFYIKQDVAGLKLKYGIKNEFPVVLLIASFRLLKKDLTQLLGQLLSYNPKVNVVCLTNGNQGLYDTIQGEFKNQERFLVVRWTEAPEEYMKMADVVISKAGGLTVSECLTLKKPMIIVNPIPGQEEHNAQFLEKNNFGVKVDSIGQVMDVLPKILESGRHAQMDLIVPENPCERIFEKILK